MTTEITSYDDEKVAFEIDTDEVCPSLFIKNGTLKFRQFLKRGQMEQLRDKLSEFLAEANGEKKGEG